MLEREKQRAMALGKPPPQSQGWRRFEDLAIIPRKREQ
jgi:hypothetical protein